MKRDLLITFDYELFLGKRSGKAYDCMIRPTNYLLELLAKHQFKGMFFVDSTYLLRLKEVKDKFPNALADFNAIANQIQAMIREGHYVFPHLHPHWIDASYNEMTNEWDLSNSSKYRFHSISEPLRGQLFDQSIELLYEIIRAVDSKYKFDSYRAGGWCIQPFEDFRPFFEKHGIVNDFSVIPGLHLVSNTHYQDFRPAPRRIYRFNSEVAKEEETGRYKEFPISTLYLSNVLNKIDEKFSLFLLALKIRPMGKGSFVNMVPSHVEDIYLMNKSESKKVSFEGFNFITFFKYFRFFSRNNYTHFASHPKLLTRLELFTINIYFFLIRKKYIVNSDYKKM